MFPSRHFIGIETLSREELLEILSLGAKYRLLLDQDDKNLTDLKNCTVANLFFENSTRTRFSFELAERRLGATVINFNNESSSSAKGETVLDTIKNLEVMKIDMVVIRHTLSGICNMLSRSVQASIINAGEGTHEHPTQALLDVLSLQQHFNEFKGLSVGIIGDILHSRVARSLVFALRLLGANVHLIGPKTLLPAHFERFGVTLHHQLDPILPELDATVSLRIQMERMESGYLPSLIEFHKAYGIDERRIGKMKSHAIIMHPGPVNRGVELSHYAVDSEKSIILDQVTNGVAVRMAVLKMIYEFRSSSL
ncbi:MAG: aspartate carbamoyltransferase catalytic subunit [Bacteroidetes bacterium]|nr:aspartate carbamoyltransferase catalytic subunit [Bacteroidota bacterium]